MTPRRCALGVAAVLLASTQQSPVLASWAVGGTGGVAATAAVLGAPTGLTIRGVRRTGLTLSWSAPSGPVPDAYEVRRNGTVISCARVAPTSCTDAGLSPGTAYRYTVTRRCTRGAAPRAPRSPRGRAGSPTSAAVRGPAAGQPAWGSSSVETTRSTRTACSNRRSWVTSSRVPV